MAKNIYLTEEISMDIMSDILQQINAFNEESAMTLEVAEELLAGDQSDLDEAEIEDIKYSIKIAQEPINFHISSGGGDVWATWGIVGAMERSVLPIITYGYGLIASGAMAIFTSGDSRCMSKYSSLMYHSVAYESPYLTVTNHEDGVKLAKNMQNTYEDIILSNSSVPRELLVESVSGSKDLYFTATEALNYELTESIF